MFYQVVVPGVIVIVVVETGVLVLAVTMYVYT